MKIWKTLAVGVPVLAAIGLSFVSLRAVVADEQRTHMEQVLTRAKTPADHDAITVSHEKAAREARQKRAEHQQLGDVYTAIPVLKTKTGAVAHGHAMAKQYEEIAMREALLGIWF